MKYKHIFDEKLAQDIYRLLYELPYESRQRIPAEFIFSLEETFSYRRPPADRDVTTEAEAYAVMILTAYTEDQLGTRQLKAFLKENHLSLWKGARLYKKVKALLLEYYPVVSSDQRKAGEYAWPKPRLIFRFGIGHSTNSPIPAKGMSDSFKEAVLLAVPGAETELYDGFNRKVVFGDYVTDAYGTVTGIMCRIECGELIRKFFGIEEDPDNDRFAEMEIGKPLHFSDTGYENGTHTNDYRHYVLEKQIATE